VIRDIGGVSTPPIRGGSFNSPHIQKGLWGEPLEGFLPPKLPLRGGEGPLQGTVGGRLSTGVKSKDMKRILVRQPQILEYTLSNLKSHVAFLESIGIPNSRIGQIISAAPSFFSYSVEQSLKPTIRYLIQEVGIEESDVGKVVQLSPQILVQRIDSAWKSRSLFLSKELGAPKHSIVKRVTKHPQLLHYSIEDGILPRINFLRSIGMRNSDILKVLTSLTQVLSLSLEENLKQSIFTWLMTLRMKFNP